MVNITQPNLLMEIYARLIAMQSISAVCYPCGRMAWVGRDIIPLTCSFLEHQSKDDSPEVVTVKEASKQNNNNLRRTFKRDNLYDE